MTTNGRALTCPCCRLSKAHQYCASCLKQGLAAHDQVNRDLQGQCASATCRAERLLHDDGPRSYTAWKALRVATSDASTRKSRLQARLKLVDEELKRGGTTDPFTAAHRPLPAPTLKNLKDVLGQIHKRQAEIEARLIHARKVLFREAISIFGVTRMPDGVYEIVGLPLPQPSHFKSYPASHLNGAVIHTVHLLHLLTSYLSLTLPYLPVFPKLDHVGRPLLRANSPFLHTSRYVSKYTLWRSASDPDRDDKSRAKYRNFLAAFGLLAHSVAYLAWSQGVEHIGVPLVEDEDPSRASTPSIKPAVAILRLLDEASHSLGLGRRSHEPGTDFVSHLGFSLDPARVVGSAVAGEVNDDGSQSEDWDVLDVTNDEVLQYASASASRTE